MPAGVWLATSVQVPGAPAWVSKAKPSGASAKMSVTARSPRHASVQLGCAAPVSGVTASAPACAGGSGVGTAAKAAATARRISVRLDRQGQVAGCA